MEDPPRDGEKMRRREQEEMLMKVRGRDRRDELRVDNGE